MQLTLRQARRNGAGITYTPISLATLYLLQPPLLTPPPSLFIPDIPPRQQPYIPWETGRKERRGRGFPSCLLTARLSRHPPTFISFIGLNMRFPLCIFTDHYSPCSRVCPSPPPPPLARSISRTRSLVQRPRTKRKVEKEQRVLEKKHTYLLTHTHTCAWRIK